jgi:adenosylcobinamide-GDP ribazoletransferase
MTEIERFLNAARFLTILPTPSATAAVEPDWLARSMKYFPLVGIGVGGAAGAVFLLAHQIWGPLVAALLAVAAGVIATGALHEDGLADTADAFGGGWTVEKRLAIMKDSRIGSFGALALGFGIAIRFAALAGLPPWAGAFALVAGHAAARVTPALIMNNMSYAGDTVAMKVSYDRAPVRSDELGFALCAAAVATLPLAFTSIASLATGLPVGAALAAALAIWSRRLIGGYTGDVLGAAEQLFEIGFLLGVAAIIR